MHPADVIQHKINYKVVYMNKFLSITALIVILQAGVANASIISESGDAGSSIATAQALAGGTTGISGTLGDVDMYGFNWSGGTFSAVVSSPAGSFLTDPQLFIFDEDGFGLFFNDDSNGFFSALNGVLLSGRYFLAISAFDIDPISSAGYIWDDFLGFSTRAPDGPGASFALTDWLVDSSVDGCLFFNDCTYQISISEVSVSAPTSEVSAPTSEVSAPTTVALLLLGIALAGYRRQHQSM
jgi:hypothetical protein